jgi:hypothetical protein
MRATDESALQREQQIAPRIEELRVRVEEAAARPQPTSILLGMSEVRVEGWEWDALVAWAARPEVSTNGDWQCLLAEGLVLQSKSLDDLGRMTEGCARADEERGAAYSDVYLDAVWGFELQRRIQRTVERLIVKGRIDHAKRLTQFRRRMIEVTTAIGRVVGEATLKEAEQAADAAPCEAALPDVAPAPESAVHAAVVTAPPSQAPEGPSAVSDDERLRQLLALEDHLRRNELLLIEESEEPTEEDLEALGTTRRPGSNRLRIVLLALLGVACVAGMLFLLKSRGAESKPMAQFALADFRDVGAITHVVARPPSLFVTVDADAWARMSPSDRRNAIESIGAKVAPAGYAGVHVTDASGRVVGSWLKGTGARVVEPSGTAS